MKRTHKLYRVPIRDMILRTRKYRYFTGIAETHKTILAENKRTGQWEDMEVLDFNLSKKGICELLNRLECEK